MQLKEQRENALPRLAPPQSSERAADVPRPARRSETIETHHDSDMKKSSVRSLALRTFARAGLIAGALLLLLRLPLGATVLDNFSGPKTGWTDTPNGGAIAQANGLFTVASAHSAGALAYSLKTSSPFANVAGDTLELRVDVNGVTPGNGDANALAVLGWVPGGGTLEANGYALYAGARNVLIKKGGSVLYSFDFVSTYGTNIQNTNVTLALRMTPSGGGVALDARVYRQSGAVVGQNFTCLFEHTVTDSSGLIGTPGYAALGVLNQASSSGASVSFANLQDFVLLDSVLDDFSVNTNLAGWTTFAKQSGVPGLNSSVTEYAPSGGNPGYVECIAGLASQGGFAGAYYAAQTFEVVDGSRLEFSVDFDNLGNDELNGGGGSYSVLGYLPVASLSAVYSLTAYHIAHDIHSSNYLVVGKNYDGWWTTGPDNLPVMNCRYTLAMTGEGANERIEARLEDLSQDINDPNRVVFQNVMVDTPASDFAGDGATIGSPAPYLNLNGAYAIFTFASGPCYEADVVFRNARVSQSIAGASPSGHFQPFSRRRGQLCVQLELGLVRGEGRPEHPCDQHFVDAQRHHLHQRLAGGHRHRHGQGPGLHSQGRIGGRGQLCRNDPGGEQPATGRRRADPFRYLPNRVCRGMRGVQLQRGRSHRRLVHR